MAGSTPVDFRFVERADAYAFVRRFLVRRLGPPGSTPGGSGGIGRGLAWGIWRSAAVPPADRLYRLAGVAGSVCAAGVEAHSGRAVVRLISFSTMLVSSRSTPGMPAR